jgi:phosphatidylglycerophosphate synthase
MFAVKRGWTPNQITLTSLILALVVSGFFATGWWPLMIVGAIGVQVSIIIDCSLHRSLFAIWCLA